MALTNSTLSAAIEAALDCRVANESSDAALRSMCGADAAAVLDAVRAAAGGTTYSLLHVHGGLLRALLNAGVCHNTRQKELYSALESDTLAQAVIAAVAKVAAAAGNGHAANEQDAIVIGVAWDLLSLCGPAVSPVVQQWVAATCAHSEIAAALAARKLATGGMKRIGGQVDLRASPSLVAALADASVAKHALVRKATQHAAAEAAPPQPSPAAVAPVPVAAAPPAVAAVEAAAAPARAASQPSSNKDVPKLSPEDRIAATHARLEALGVAYTTTRHAAANNVEELLAALAIVGPAGTRCKNLYVKAKKEKAANDSRTWLVVAAHDTKVDLVDLAKRLGYGKIVIRFGDTESMLENLAVAPGNVTPLALAYDEALLVNVALDKKLFDAGADPLYVHPLTNEASTALSGAALLKFMESTGHAPQIIDFAAPL